MSNWQLGLQAFREGRVREAADRLQLAAGEEEMTVSLMARYQTMAFLGAALYALGRPAEAASAFETALHLAPPRTPSADLSLNLAHAYLATGRRQAAHSILTLLLDKTPGHVAARMLLQRLKQTPADERVTGTILGESVESVQKYLRTLTFSSVSSSGYDPAQVREALSQMEKYLHAVNNRLQSSQETIARQEEELQRLRQAEEAMIQNLIQMQQAGHSADQDPAASAEKHTLSPIEALFQQKP